MAVQHRMAPSIPHGWPIESWGFGVSGVLFSNWDNVVCAILIVTALLEVVVGKYPAVFLDPNHQQAELIFSRPETEKYLRNVVNSESNLEAAGQG